MPRITVENAFIEEFISEYKIHECLWNVGCRFYHNHLKREEAYEILRKIAEKHFGTTIATKSFVVNKIKNLRTAFKKELNKVLNSKNKVYVPKLWYYESLNFVANDHILKKSNSKPYQKVTQTKVVEEDENKFELHNILHTVKDDETTSFSISESMLFSDRSSTASPDNLRSSPIHNSTSLSESTRNTSLRMKRTLDSTETEDEFDIAGKHFASQLRGLDQEQRILVEKLIADVVFEARLKRLKTTSVIWTPDKENS